MKLLSKEFVVGAANQPDRQCHFKQIAREGRRAIYETFRLINGEPKILDYEVILIGSHNGFYLNGGRVFVEPSETYASTNSWGVHGFTEMTKERAYKRFNELNNMNTNEVNNENNETINDKPKRGRKAKPFSFPVGPFKVKELAETLGVSIALIHNKIHEAGTHISILDKIKTSTGKGRAANVYQYEPTVASVPEAPQSEILEDNDEETSEELDETPKTAKVEEYEEAF